MVWDHDLEYTFDRFVIGYSLEALEYAYAHRLPILINGDSRPFPHLTSPTGETLRSTWYDLVFKIGLRSLLPVPFDVETIRIEDQTATVITQRNSKIKINFGALVIFDFEKVVGLNIEEEVESYYVYDCFDIKRGSLFDKNAPAFKIYRSQKFLKEVVFYPSTRVSQNVDGRYKDIWVCSEIEAPDIDNFDYSATVLKILLQRNLAKSRYFAKDGRAFVIEHASREKHKHKVNYRHLQNKEKHIILGRTLLQ